MIFIKLLAVLALIVALAVGFISLPQIFARRLAERGSKYKELPICIVTVFLIAAVICYCYMKNTFWGFISAWTAVFLFLCLVITMIRFYAGQREYCKRFFVKYSRNFVVIFNVSVVVILGITVAVADRISSKLPDTGNIEAVYFGHTPLQAQLDNGNLSPKYAIIHSDEIVGTVKKITDFDIPEEEGAVIAQNLKLAATDIRTDEGSFHEILTICNDLNHSFFKQQFSRRFKITENKDENLYFYVAFRLKNGKIINKRYESGKHNIAVPEREEYSPATLDARIELLQKSIESPDSYIREAGVNYRLGGEYGEQLFSSDTYDKILISLKNDGILPDTEKSDPSIVRMCVYYIRTHAVPPVYRAYGIEDRNVMEYYSVLKNNINTWNTISDLLVFRNNP